MQASPQALASSTNRCGEKVPSECVVWRCRSAKRDGVLESWSGGVVVDGFIALLHDSNTPVVLQLFVAVRASRGMSFLARSRMPLTNLPLSAVLNFLAMSTASLIETTGGTSGRCNIS